MFQTQDASGKIVAVAQLTPTGVHNVVSAGWRLLRRRWTHDWRDRKQLTPGNGRHDYWNTTWVDDTEPGMSALTPDIDDKIYDTDAPNLNSGYASTDCETNNNFEQWVEWNNEPCSEHVPWYFQARFRQGRVILCDVKPANIKLPESSFFH
jgi:hypothetical protein